MFTGLVEEMGTVKKVDRRRGSILLSIEGRKTSKGLRVDESICVDGACLTVVEKQNTIFRVQAVEETLTKTTLGKRKAGELVNLERPLRPDTALGGHFVLGHVDGIGTIREIDQRGSSWMIWIAVAKEFRKFLIPVGSIAVNGVSLTIADLDNQVFAVSIIPHTWDVTTFHRLKKGDFVNVEFDVLGKYVDQIMKYRKS